MCPSFRNDFILSLLSGAIGTRLNVSGPPAYLRTVIVESELIRVYEYRRGVGGT
jgi:hypothetical protein